MFPRHLNLREKQNIFLINNNGMPKERANSGQHHEKTMWALSELEICFKNREAVGWVGCYYCKPLVRMLSRPLALVPGREWASPPLWRANPGPQAQHLQHLGGQQSSPLIRGHSWHALVSWSQKSNRNGFLQMTVHPRSSRQ